MKTHKTLFKVAIGRIIASMTGSGRRERIANAVRAKYCTGCQEGHARLDMPVWHPYGEQIAQTVQEGLDGRLNILV